MNAEKIKQMGRDYFKANPDTVSLPSADPAFLDWRKSHQTMSEDLKSCSLWAEGYNEARYAASKEGRAIELLGKLAQASYSGDIAAIAFAEIKAADFLKEIGWKPNA